MGMRWLLEPPSIHGHGVGEVMILPPLSLGDVFFVLELENDRVVRREEIEKVAEPLVVRIRPKNRPDAPPSRPHHDLGHRLITLQQSSDEQTNRAFRRSF